MPRDQQHRKRGHHQVAEDTKRRKSLHSLLDWEVQNAKRMDKLGMTTEEIAAAIGQPVRDIELALASSRGRVPDSPFAVINTDKLTKARFLSHRLPDDRSDHDALVRLLDQAEAYQRLHKRTH